MSRAGNVDVVTVKPANNIYTALTLIAFLVVLASFIVLYVRADKVLGGGLFS
jgi:hypothetical protein